MRRRIVVPVLLLPLILLTLAYGLGKGTVDPNTSTPRDNAEQIQAEPRTAEEQPDPRLSRKITYRVKLRQISDVTDDLSKMTGIVLVAGRSKSDWLVREDCTTIMAKDIPLAELMDSISHVMKMRWVRTGKSPNWCYRLVEDPVAVRKIEDQVAQQSKRDAEARRQYWDKLQAASRMSDTELAGLRETDPGLYLLAKTGRAKPLVDFMNAAPDFRDSWLAGEEMAVGFGWLNTVAQKAVLSVTNADIRYQARLYGGDEAADSAYEKLIGGLNDAVKKAVVKLDKGVDISVPPSLPSSQFSLDVGWCSLPLCESTNDIQRMNDKLELRAYEEQRPYREVWNEVKTEWRKAAAKQHSRVTLYSQTEEFPIEHHDDPALNVPLAKEVKPKVITSLVESFADAGGFSIVTDDFRGKTKLAFEKGSDTRKALEAIANEVGFHNWNRNGQVIELWSYDWYDRRKARVSKVWLEGLRQRFKTNGTLDLDDLADMAGLTDAQIGKNISNDDVLQYAAGTVCSSKRDYLKIYSSLTSGQRSLLMSDDGIAFSDLSPSQQQSIIGLVAGTSVPLVQSLDLAGLGACITCTRQAVGKQYVYTLQASTKFGRIPGQYRFRTPLYVEPPKPNEKPKGSTLNANR